LKEAGGAAAALWSYKPGVLAVESPVRRHVVAAVEASTFCTEMIAPVRADPVVLKTRRRAVIIDTTAVACADTSDLRHRSRRV
jgi:hypothetical protein